MKKAVLLIVLFGLIFASTQVIALPGTCKNPAGGNYCGAHSDVSKCYCDTVCVNFGDCCDDYKIVCSPAICAKYACPAPPSGCEYTSEIVNGCPTCGKLVCKNQTPVCGNNICETGEDFYCAPCNAPPGAVCTAECKPIQGTCPQDCKKPVCGNGICDEGEAGGCPPVGEGPCWSGSCPKDCKQTCFDSDGGQNFYVKGIVTIGVNEGGFSDFCLDSNQLIEYYCSDNEANKIDYKCPNGCKDGACVSTKQITKQDVISWINDNCYNSPSITPVTGAAIKKAPIIIY